MSALVDFSNCHTSSSAAADDEVSLGPDLRARETEDRAKVSALADLSNCHTEESAAATTKYLLVQISLPGRPRIGLK